MLEEESGRLGVEKGEVKVVDMSWGRTGAWRGGDKTWWKLCVEGSWMGYGMVEHWGSVMGMLEALEVMGGIEVGWLLMVLGKGWVGNIESWMLLDVGGDKGSWHVSMKDTWKELKIWSVVGSHSWYVMISPYLSMAASTFTSFTYICHWHKHSIASFMPAIQLLRSHCLIAIACIMTQITLPHCYLMTQICFPVYKTPFQRRRALSLFSCIFRLNTVVLHDPLTWVLPESCWT